MLQERSHVNYVWQKMRQELPTRDVATNYMEVVTCDYEYSMHIILMRRHDFLASAFLNITLMRETLTIVLGSKE